MDWSSLALAMNALRYSSHIGSDDVSITNIVNIAEVFNLAEWRESLISNTLEKTNNSKYQA